MADKREVYLDHNATTPVHPEVLDAMLPYYREEYGNASSMHSWGQRARRGIDKARGQLAGVLEVSPEEIIFTGSGTEADNLAIKGVAAAVTDGPGHLITSAIEHPAVLESCNFLAEAGWAVTYLPVDHHGIVDPEALRRALRPDTALVSVMYANNEVGTIQPLRELADRTHEHGALFHTDAIQALGKLPINPVALGVDLMSMSAHKIYGPKGVGALYIRKGTRLRSQLHGGGHEFKRRASTENVAGIAGFGAAAVRIDAHRENEMARQRALSDRLEAGIKAAIKEVAVHGHREQRLAGTLNVGFRYIEGEGVLLNLDLVGIAVSTGSACASGKLEPSHVLMEMGLSHADAQGAIRFSLGEGTTEADIDYVVTELPPIIERLRSMSPLWEG